MIQTEPCSWPAPSTYATAAGCRGGSSVAAAAAEERTTTATICAFGCNSSCPAASAANAFLEHAAESVCAIEAAYGDGA